MAYRDLVLADNPASYYEMETGVGTDARGARTLTLSGGITTGVAGNVGNGWSFDGVDDGASMATFPAISTAFSFEAWFKSPTNGGWSNDYPTIIRRDGTDIVLLRGRGSNIAGNVNPGKAEAYVAGLTLVSTNRVDDGSWHHIVLTVSGTTARLYVDGSQVATGSTGKTTYSLGTGVAYIGSNAALASERYKGSLDNVAIYTSALSATRVSEHYNAAAPVPGGYVGQVMTASASMPGGQPVLPKAVAVAPMTAQADWPGGKGAILASITTNRDASSNGLGAGLNTTANLSTGILVDFELPSGLSNQGLVSATLTVNTEGPASLTAKRITSEWTMGEEYSGAFSAASATSSTTGAGIRTTTFDVTNLIDTGSFYGIQLTGSGLYYTQESGAQAPRLNLTYSVVNAEGGHLAQPMTAESSMGEVSVGFAKTINAEPFTATAELVNAIVVGERLFTYEAQPLEAFAEMPGGEFAAPVTINAEPFIAEAMVPDATTETAQGVVYFAEPLAATASIIKPALVNDEPIVINESDDKYFQRVFALAPKVYQRLNDKGSAVVDRMGTYNGTYHGVQVGKFDAPDGRHSVHFPVGSYLEQTEPSGTNTDEASVQDGTALATTLEFSMRTVKGNAFILAGADSTQTSAGVKSSYAARELLLKDGRLTFRSRLFAGTPDQIEKEFSGVRNIADGKWHTIVVKSGVYSRGEWATELWIDGTFEVRRFNVNGFHGFPDYIGWRPSLIDGSELEALPLSQSFVGDMTEVAFYNHNNLPSHDIARNYYAFMGWAPIAAEPFEGTAVMGDSRGKGSQKKALYLYWNATDEVFQGAPFPEYGVSFDPMPGFVERATSAPNLPFTHEERVGDYHGMKVFSRSVRVTTSNTSYRDPLTDDPSLINLESDIDLDDYDVIMFKDWPDEGPELDDIEVNFPGQKERLIAQLRDANDRGVGLNITNPRMAVDLGIVGRVEYVGNLKEKKFNKNQGASYGNYDYGAAVNFPWNIVASDGLTGGQFATGIGQTQILSPSYLENKAFFYSDTHQNNRFRVRALVEGLTDIPSWMVADAVWHVDYDQYGWQGAAYKYLKADEGLQIGDEYIFNGAEVIDPVWLDAVQRRYNRFNGTWATPMSHVKVGTVVTTFGAKHWLGTSIVDNPYRDYATTIVLQPGDVLNGRPVGGRIFVNFTEQPSYGLAAIKQVLPESDNDVNWPYLYPVETAAQREWDYSWTRTTLTSTQSTPSRSEVQITLPDGSQGSVLLGNKEDNDILSMVRSNQFFDIEGHPRLEMTARGIYWLADYDAPEEGAVTVRAVAMNATAEMPKAKVTARKTATVIAQPMLVTASMPRVKEDTNGSVSIPALPFTAEGTFSGYGKTITAAPMLATAEMVEPFDAVHAEGEQVRLILHNYEATLFIKEEA